MLRPSWFMSTAHKTKYGATGIKCSRLNATNTKFDYTKTARRQQRNQCDDIPVREAERYQSRVTWTLIVSHLLYLLHLPFEVCLALGPLKLVLLFLAEKLFNDLHVLFALVMIANALCPGGEKAKSTKAQKQQIVKDKSKKAKHSKRTRIHYDKRSLTVLSVSIVQQQQEYDIFLFIGEAYKNFVENMASILAGLGSFRSSCKLYMESSLVWGPGISIVFSSHHGWPPRIIRTRLSWMSYWYACL